MIGAPQDHDGDKKRHADGRHQNGNRGIATTDAPGASETGDLSRADRSPLQETPQIFHQAQSARVASRRVLFQAFQADGLEIEGHLRIGFAQTGRLGLLDLLEDLEVGTARKRHVPGEQFVEDDTEAVDVGLRRVLRRAVLQLLGEAPVSDTWFATPLLLMKTLPKATLDAGVASIVSLNVKTKSGLFGSVIIFLRIILDFILEPSFSSYSFQCSPSIVKSSSSKSLGSTGRPGRFGF